ncbi:TPA: sugar ABC transporter ATP-binding protein [Candidatus Gastranaerophilales bacterium HUM_8]|mgnify:FL=1|nr:MAG TPA: sugar ABC transporter ATP-binding protein [Candidatus Gastranaerophilales bacterium HUM_8]
MSSVILRNLVKSYDGNKNVIDNINLEIKDKEFIVLVGSSGCGKSTILRLISGLEDITSGEILIDGKVVNSEHPKDRDIAFVFQSYALYPHMSVYDNIAFGLKMRKYSKAVIDEKVHEVAKALDLADLLNRKPRQLSGGQRQRVALGRAIVRNPKVFLMDEPLSNLDANLRVQMRSEIKRLHQKLQTTFIYVTHDQTEALTMGDRIVVLDKGKIQQADSPEVIYNNPKNKFVAGFIGQMNFIDVNVINGKFEINGHQFETNKQINGEVIAAIRAEKMICGDTVLTVTPDIVEMTGGERIIYFNLNGNKCSARLPLDYPIGGQVELRISEKDMYFFDKGSGEII